MKSYDMILPLVVNYCCQRQRTCAAYWNVYFQAVARVCKRYLISFIHSFIFVYYQLWSFLAGWHKNLDSGFSLIHAYSVRRSFLVMYGCFSIVFSWTFLATGRTNGRAYAIMLRPSVAVCRRLSSVTYVLWINGAS